MNYPKITLHKGKEVSLQRQHPWVFSGAIKIKDADLKDGDVVEVFSAGNEFLGIGHFQLSSISVRILSFERTNIDDEFWFRKISNGLRRLRPTRARGFIGSNTMASPVPEMPRWLWM